MNISLLHLSDIHLKESKNEIFGKIQELAKAISEPIKQTTCCFIVLSGDIAFSGEEKQYQVASEFISKLEKEIQEIKRDIDLHYIFVPGNHDCNFKKHTTPREILISQAVNNISLRDNEDLLSQCVVVQDEFFEWVKNQFGVELNGKSKLYYERIFNVGDKYAVKFNCYNTSWMSLENGRGGEVVFPIKFISNENEGFTLVFSVLHHPYSWIRSDRSREFRKKLEISSNVVITGHEHDATFYDKRYFSGESNKYMEGGVLQNTNESSFNLLLLDLKNRQLKYHKFNLEQGIYIPHKEDIEWEKIPESTTLKQDKFINREEFLASLKDPGDPYRHPRKKPLTLQDIYVYPDLSQRILKKEDLIIESNRVSNFIFDNKKILIMGLDLSGKTALLKMTYMDFQDRGVIPVILDGKKLVSSKENKIKRVINESFNIQYRPEYFIEYFRLNKEEKAIFIDDFDKVELNREAKIRILKYLEQYFDRIVITSGDVFELEEVLERDDSGNMLDYYHCDIQEFGHLLTVKMIERWCYLDREDTANEVEIGRQIERVKSVIRTIMGPNLLPSYPFFILSIIQGSEDIGVIVATSKQAGSFGFYYEMLITYALSAPTQRTWDLNTLYNYLAELAYYMYQNKQDSLSAIELGKFHSEYLKKYALTVYDLPFVELMDDLIRARMLWFADGNYEFRYKYVYYYFIARAINNRLQKPKTRSEIEDKIREFTEGICEEDCANILIFISYMSQDPFIREAMLNSAGRQFPENKLFDINKDTEFINRYSPSVRVLLPKDTPKEAREKVYKKQDEIERKKGKAKDEEDDEDKDQIKEEIENILKPIRNGFRTVQVMGQVLRNYAGSLEEGEKYPLAESCYLLGLRSMTAIFDVFRETVDGFIEVQKRLLAERDKRENINIPESQRKYKTERQLHYESSSVAFLLTAGSTNGMIKITSRAVGSEKLGIILDRVLEKHRDLVTVSFIDLGVKLDCYIPMPLKEIFNLVDELGNNPLGLIVLANLVCERMYLIGCKYDEKQSICKKLPIAVDDPRLLVSRQRKLTAVKRTTLGKATKK